MDVTVDLISAKKIKVFVDASDTTLDLKRKIAEETGIQPKRQVLRFPNTGELLPEAACVFDTLKSKGCRKVTVEYSRVKKSKDFFLDTVTCTGRVFRLVLPKGKLSTVKYVKGEISRLIKVPEEHIFLRVVNTAQYLSIPLGEEYKTLEECAVPEGAVLYVQIHPYLQFWYHGRITREQAEGMMKPFSRDGSFLVKESVHFPGDYVIFLCFRGIVKHYHVKWKKNMMFTLDENAFYDSITEMVENYQSHKGNLPTKLTEVVAKPANGFVKSTHHEPPSPYKSDRTPSPDVFKRRSRLQTEASSDLDAETIIQVVLLDSQQRLRIPTHAYTTVYELKRLVEREKGIPADWQFLHRAPNGCESGTKSLPMNSFLLSDYHVTSETVLLVQVHPWTEKWYVGKASKSEVDTVLRTPGSFLVKESLTRPGTYVLCVRCGLEVLSYQILLSNTMFTIDNRERFRALRQLVEHYMNHKGCLRTQLGTPVVMDRNMKNEYMSRDRSSDDDCSIPAEVLARGQKARAAYNRALEKGRTRDSRVRIMLIGQDRAGKTSLKKSIKGERFNLQEVSTNGVEIGRSLQHVGRGPWMEATSYAGRSEFDCKVAEFVARKLSSSGSSSESISIFSRDSVFDDSLDGGPNDRVNALSSTGKASALEEPNAKGLPATDELNGFKPISPRCSTPARSNLSENIADILEPHPDPLLEVTDLVEAFLLQDANPLSAGEVQPVFWDFAGQSVYHATHPVFMSPRAIYLLVWDLSRNIYAPAECRVREPGMDERVVESGSRGMGTNLDHVTRWLSLVHFLHQSEPELGGQMLPPVVLVGTHADCSEGNPTESVESVLKAVLGRDFSGHVIADQFAVNNTRAGRPVDEEDPEIHKLRQTLVSLAQSLPHTKEDVPLQWLHVEKIVELLAQEGVKFMQKQEFEVVSSKVCDFEHEDDCEELLAFLHNRGTVVYFGRSAAKAGELVVLNPSWLVDLFSQIITVIPGQSEPLKIRQSRRRLEHEGVLSAELVSFACNKLNLNNLQETLLRIMERIGLVCQWPERNGQQSMYLVPSMLTVRSSSDIGAVTQSCHVKPVYVTFPAGYVPPGFFPKLLVSFARWCATQWSPEQPKLFANAARYFVGRRNDISLVIVCHASVIKVCVTEETQMSPSRELMSICQEVRRFLDGMFSKLQLDLPWFHAVRPQLCARCDLCREETGSGNDGCVLHHVPHCPHDDCAHFIPVEPSPLRCNRTFGETTLLDERSMKPWRRGFDDERTPHNREIAYKTGRVSKDDLLSVASELRASEWKGLCGVLLNEHESEHIEHDERSLFDKCYRVLTRWTQAQASRATYGALAAALMHDAVRLEDLVTKYCVQS